MPLALGNSTIVKILLVNWSYMMVDGNVLAHKINQIFEKYQEHRNGKNDRTG